MVENGRGECQYRGLERIILQPGDQIRGGFRQIMVVVEQALCSRLAEAGELHSICPDPGRAEEACEYANTPIRMLTLIFS